MALPLIVGLFSSGLSAKSGSVLVEKTAGSVTPIVNEEIFWMPDPQRDMAAYEAYFEKAKDAYAALLEQKSTAKERTETAQNAYQARIGMFRANIERDAAATAMAITAKLQRLKDDQKRQQLDYPNFTRDLAEWQRENASAVKTRLTALEATRLALHKQIAALDAHDSDGAVGRQILAVIERIAAREKLPLSQFTRTTQPKQLEEYLSWSKSETGRYDDLIRKAYIHPETRSVFINLYPKFTMYAQERGEIEAILKKFVENQEQSPVTLLNARHELVRLDHQIKVTATAKLVAMSEQLADAAGRAEALEARMTSLREELAVATGDHTKAVEQLASTDAEISRLRTDLLLAETDARIDLDSAKAELCVASARKIARERIAAAQSVHTDNKGDFTVPDGAYRAFSFHADGASYLAWDSTGLQDVELVELNQKAQVTGVRNRDGLLDHVAKEETSLWAVLLDRKIPSGAPSDPYRAARR